MTGVPFQKMEVKILKISWRCQFFSEDHSQFEMGILPGDDDSNKPREVRISNNIVFGMIAT